MPGGRHLRAKRLALYEKKHLVLLRGGKSATGHTVVFPRIDVASRIDHSIGTVLQHRHVTTSYRPDKLSSRYPNTGS